jgi:ATP-dependent RNA circularization protein (DNA/RNA ligase family)
MAKPFLSGKISSAKNLYYFYFTISSAKEKRPVPMRGKIYGEFFIRIP